MDKALERLKTEFASEGARYAYADSVTNAFLTAQIKALRENRGLTQEKLAEHVGTKQSGISRWQNSGYSSCKVETLRKFAKAFGVRLRIRFEEFGTLPDEVRGFDEKNLAPRRFEDDLAFKEKADLPEETAAVLMSPNHHTFTGLVDYSTSQHQDVYSQALLKSFESPALAAFFLPRSAGAIGPPASQPKPPARSLHIVPKAYLDPQRQIINPAA